MCGIAGIWASDRRAVEEGIRAMLRAQSHRGPDDEGSLLRHLPAGFLGLGHRRLSIQDLSPAGHQPMENPETGDWIVFNGEIYNYPELRCELEAAGAIFRSNCDTEVILHAFARWGVETFNRLHGMFALGLWSSRQQQLVMARDPLGIKPLYYAWNSRGLVFASELRAAAASGLVEPEVDRRALAGLMAYGAVPGPMSMLRSVRLLEPGTWACVDLTADAFASRQLRPVRYWDFPAPRRAEASGAETCEKIHALLADSVRSHLISDVPVGVFLSSGLDSTAVASLCSEVHKGGLDTFTVSLADDPHLDENPVAEATARTLGTRHHAIRLTEQELQDLTRDWLDSLDQPSMDGLNTYIISRAVRQRGIIVALSGLGGDEVFGGYPTFRQVPRLARLSRGANWMPAPLRSRLARLFCCRGTRTQRQKAVELAGGDLSLPAIYYRRRRLLSDRDMEGLGLRASQLDLTDGFLPDESEPQRGLFADDPVASIAVLESRSYMGNMLLRDSDVFGMAHGLEIRVPLLHRPLVDYMFSVPGPARMSGNGSNKPLLAGAMSGRIPPDPLRLAKRGFALPHARWMAGPLRERFESLVDVTRQSGLLNPPGVTAVWQGFLNERGGPAWSRAWTLGVLGAWLSHV